MKAPTYLKPLRIELEDCQLRIGDIFHICGTIRVEGWMAAPNKARGFDACQRFGDYLGRSRGIGGYCDERDPAKAVDFPISFDCRFELVSPSYREETKEEAIERVTKTLYRAKRHFAKLAPVAA